MNRRPEPSLWRAALARLAQAGYPQPERAAADLWNAAAAPQAFSALLERAAAGEPVEYLTGRAFFHGLELEVSPDVLIPRPDSETVVELALEAVPRDRSARVADLGTGCGCLLLAVLRQRPRLRGLGVDLSRAALAVAARNARRHGLADRACFAWGDWLSAVAGDSLDLIVANPPYVVPGEALGSGVAEHEPHLALFTPPERPLAAYQAILAAARFSLRRGGTIVLEAGAGRAAAVAEVCAAHGFRVGEIRKDLGGIERALRAENARSG